MFTGDSDYTRHACFKLFLHGVTFECGDVHCITLLVVVLSVLLSACCYSV